MLETAIIRSPQSLQYLNVSSVCNSGFGQNLTGVRGIRVEEPRDIAAALQQALAADEPVVVDVVTDLEPRAPEAWVPPRQ